MEDAQRGAEGSEAPRGSACTEQSCQQSQRRLVGSASGARGRAGRASIQALGRGTGPSLLGVGFLQQARPELLFAARVNEVLIVQDR